MSRLVVVSNRVLDLSKAARAGGVAVTLADIVRTHKALRFGWNGEIRPASEADVVERETRIVSEIEYAGYYLGYANSVLWPVFHNRLDLAQFEAGFFDRFASLAGSINGRLSELDWVPIHYIYRSMPRRKLGDIYRSSQICMVTPLRNGMNLIAKEYVAAQDAADPGVLILSQFAGAAEEMTEALIVNPYNIDETADALRGAPEMDLTERRTRHGELLQGVYKHDAAAWSRLFLEHLERARFSASHEVA